VNKLLGRIIASSCIPRRGVRVLAVEYLSEGLKKYEKRYKNESEIEKKHEEIIHEKSILETS